MFQDIWQLAKLTIASDNRRVSTHAIRLGLLIVLYLAVVYARIYSMVNASGRFLFHSQLVITIVFLSVTAIFGFSQAITEEKDEETLGLLRLADISPLAIILGKLASLFFDASFLIAIQFVFTELAMTLGGISWAQILSAYVALFAYLWLLVNVSLLISIIEPNGNRAARTTAIFVGVYLLIAPAVMNLNWLGPQKVLIQILSYVSIPMRMTSIVESDFSDSPWSWPVLFCIVAGTICLIVSTWLFDWIIFKGWSLTLRSARVAKPREPRRAWPNAVAWREFAIVNGGRPWVSVRLLVQIGILATNIIAFETMIGYGTIGFTLIWSALYGAVFALLDTSWTCSRLFQDEMRFQTWTNLVMTSKSIAQLARDKCVGVFLVLWPTIMGPCVFLVATIFSHEHIRWNSWQSVELILGSSSIFLGMLGYLHLLVLLSLYMGWKAIPATLTSCFALGWIATAAIHANGRGDTARFQSYIIVCVIIAALILVLQRLVLRRLQVLAATA